MRRARIPSRQRHHRRSECPHTSSGMASGHHDVFFATSGKRPLSPRRLQAKATPPVSQGRRRFCDDEKGQSLFVIFITGAPAARACPLRAPPCYLDEAGHEATEGLFCWVRSTTLRCAARASTTSRTSTWTYPWARSWASPASRARAKARSRSGSSTRRARAATSRRSPPTRVGASRRRARRASTTCATSPRRSRSISAPSFPVCARPSARRASY